MVRPSGDLDRPVALRLAAHVAGQKDCEQAIVRSATTKISNDELKKFDLFI